jgi:hypothetical protein
VHVPLLCGWPFSSACRSCNCANRIIAAAAAAQGRCLSAGNEVAAQDVLELLIEVAEAYPRFLRKQLQDMVSAMMQVRLVGGGYVGGMVCVKEGPSCQQQHWWLCAADRPCETAAGLFVMLQ